MTTFVFHALCILTMSMQLRARFSGKVAFRNAESFFFFFRCVVACKNLG